MGLDLEPVVVSSSRQIGCRVKDFYFDIDHSGVDPVLLQRSVSVGDVMDTVDGESVLSMPFPDIVALLRGSKDRPRVVVFRRMTLDNASMTTTPTQHKQYKLTLQELDSPSSSMSSMPRLNGQANKKQPVPAVVPQAAVETELLVSPKAVKRLSESNLFSPTTYSYLSSFEPVGQRSSTANTVSTPVPSTGPLARVLGTVATVVKDKAVKAALAVTDVISGQAEQAIEVIYFSVFILFNSTQLIVRTSLVSESRPSISCLDFRLRT